MLDLPFVISQNTDHASVHAKSGDLSDIEYATQTSWNYYHVGRNGRTTYGGILIAPGFNNDVLLIKLNRKGYAINGTSVIPVSHMDALAVAWCKARGLVVEKQGV